MSVCLPNVTFIHSKQKVGQSWLKVHGQIDVKNESQMVDIISHTESLRLMLICHMTYSN